MNLKELEKFYTLLSSGKEVYVELMLPLTESFPYVHRAALGHLKNNNEKSLSALLTALERELKVSLTDSEIIVSNRDLTPPSTKPFPIVFILENIRSAFNIGSIIRLANAINAEEVILCGYTASPDHPAVKKTAMHSETQIKITETQSLKDAVTHLKNRNFEIVALETAEPSTDLFTWKPNKKPVALWVGNERFGIDSESLKLADTVLSIPMFGSKNSLNVAQALSVVSYDWLRQFLT